MPLPILAGFKLAQGVGKIGKVLSAGWSLAKKGSDWIQSNKNLGDAVVNKDIAVVDTGAGYFVTNKQGGQMAKFLPWLVGGGLLLMLKK